MAKMAAAFDMILLFILAWLVFGFADQQPLREQTAFGAEDEPPIKRPVDITEDVLGVLRKDAFEDVIGCLEEDNLPKSPNSIPASWFVGSEIHLNGPNEIDLVVHPRDLTQIKPTPNRCFYGANVVSFWIVRRTPQGPALVLSVRTLGLEILESRHNGFRDIRISHNSGIGRGVIITFRFDGKKYVVHRTRIKQIR